MNQQLVLNCVLCFLVGFFLHSILKHGFCSGNVIEGQASTAKCKNKYDEHAEEGKGCHYLIHNKKMMKCDDFERGDYAGYCDRSCNLGPYCTKKALDEEEKACEGTWNNDTLICERKDKGEGTGAGAGAGGGGTGGAGAG